jgi:hypothetical protein
MSRWLHAAAVWFTDSESAESVAGPEVLLCLDQPRES